MMLKHLFAALVVLLSPILAHSEMPTFETSDGVMIVGEFYRPSSQKYTIILHHGLGSVREEWTGFAEYLASEGYGVFIYDARGHGKSTQTKSGKKIDFHYFFGRGLKSEWGQMIEDMDSAVQLLSKSYNIDRKHIAVGGASIGANIAFRYAATHPDVPFTLLLSPGLDYQGISTNDLFPSYLKSRRRILIVSSKPDRYANRSARALKEVSSLLGAGPLATFYTEKRGHGTQMFARQNPRQPSELEAKISKWIGAQQN